MSLTFTILGCGSSTGVPRVAMGWGECNPSNPKNRRRRCSLLVEQRTERGQTTILIDTSPDLRQQLLDTSVSWIDGVLFTHEHADHTHGLDDLRTIVLHNHRRVDVYLDELTAKVLRARFGYCFETPPGGAYPPILNEQRIVPLRPVTINGQGGPVAAIPFPQVHGDISSLGFRLGGLAYSADVNGIPPESLATLKGLDVWIIDALRFRPHPSHFCVDEALSWIERVKPKHAILTNLHSDLDYETLRSKLPPHVEPAFDGMVLTLPELA